MASLPQGLVLRYSLALMVLAAAAVAVGGAVQLYTTYHDTREAASSIQRAEAGAAASRIGQYLESVESAVRETGSLPWGEAGLGDADRREEYHRLMKRMPAISELRSIDASGRERLFVSRIDMDRIGSGRDASEVLALARRGSRGAAYGRPHFRDGSEPFVTLAVLEPGGRAVTAAEVDLKFVGELVRTIHIGKAGRVFVVDGDDRLLAHPDKDLVLRKTELRAYPPLAELRGRLSQDGEVVAGMIEGEGLAGGTALMSAALVSPLRWIAVAEQPRSEVLAPVFAALERTGLLVLVTFVLALGLGMAFARRMASPILEITRGAERIGRGDLDVRIALDRRDELGRLASEFNHMAAQLQEYTAGLEKKVAERTSELQAALRARALFLAAASHDLRQPLYAISLLADTLSSEELDEGSAAILAKQREAIAVLRALFDNLLDLSRFDAGEVKPVLRVVPLREVLAPAILETEVLCHARGLSFHSDVPEAWVSTDPDLLRRVASNLLSNAVRYTPEGGVMLACWASDGVVTMEIRDTGIGIPPEHQQRVFEEFVQLGNPGRERDKGVGLGLSIVKRICDLLGVPLEMTSTPGRGTSFSLRIPLAAAEDARPVAPAPRLPAAEALSGARVWVVEDDPMVRDALGLQFAAWGVMHAFARTRADLEALHAADGRWPDAAMLDDMLGAGESGLDIATWLRERMGDAIVLVTGNVDAARLAALEASGLAVLRKPLSSADLAQCLARAMRAAAGT